MITLCPTTWESAAKMRNFSKWIREQITWKDQGFEIRELLEEVDRLESLLSAVAMGEKVWKQGVGWVDNE
jgi:hypothetical protein